MNIKAKRITVYLFIATLIALFALCAVPSKPFGVFADMKTDDKTEYEIYPAPHVVTYTDGAVTVPDEVGVAFGGGIDEATVNNAYAALSVIDVLAYENGDKAFRVLVGVAGSGDIADKFITDNSVPYDSGLFDKNDSYILYIGDGAIVALGKDSDSAFYGVTTLKMILGQSGKTVRKLKIQDWSDCVFRGFIEGYYGIPWTTEERVELMKFGSRFKTNIYIYAPKDDAYHSSNWRGLYSAADLAELKEQIEAGTQTKTRFAWAIHPFLHDKFTQANYNKDLIAVLKKFEQLYNAGVRQFVISADDVDTSAGNMIDATMHKNLLNDVTDWLRDKGDCYDLIFVPSAYCYKSGQGLGVNLQYYYKTLMSGLDSSVYVMWTGDAVCSTVESGRFDEFTALSGRKAFMWLNWPVNDYAQSFLLMGKGDVLNKKLPDGEEPNFYGIVTNPMQLAEASKLSIFAIADYCWNINGFDCEASYAASFKYIESAAPSQLNELCGHLVNATPYEGAYFDESVEIKPYIDAFVEAYEKADGIVKAAQNLKAQFDKIVTAAQEYSDTATNVKLLNTLRPWVQSLSLLAEACSDYMDIFIGLDTLSDSKLAELYYSAQEHIAAREDCKSPILNTVTHNHDDQTVNVAPAVLTPFLAKVTGFAADELAVRAGVNTGNTYFGFDGIYEGKMEYITDGDDNTYVWMDGYLTEGTYIRIDLGKLTEITSVRALMGKPDGGDTMIGQLEYSTDGKTYYKLGDLTGEETLIILDSPVQARFIRLYNTNTETWVAVREVSVNTLA